MVSSARYGLLLAEAIDHTRMAVTRATRILSVGRAYAP